MKKTIFTFLICSFFATISLGQNLKLNTVKQINTPTLGGGILSVYVDSNDFNPANLSHLKDVRIKIISIFNEYPNVNQMTIFFLNKIIYDWDALSTNDFKHPIPSIINDVNFLVVANLSKNNSERCATVINRTSKSILEKDILNVCITY
jgi:hypothetical protein